MKIRRRALILAATLALVGVMTGCNSAPKHTEPVVYRGNPDRIGFNHFAAADAIGNRIFFQEAAGYQLVYGHERPDITATRLARARQSQDLAPVVNVPTDD
ncbi:MAG: hypothetical protein ACYTGQ_07815 [Planctomycetota bacterium]